jgi:hypothetical protein
MLPLLAVSAAASTVDKVASGAASIWKHLSKAGASNSGNAAAPASFASLLSGQGIDVASMVPGLAGAGQTPSPQTSTGSGSVNRLA